MFDEYLIILGFNEEQIDLIRSSYPLNTYRESTLLYNAKNMVNYLHRNTFDNKDIIKVFNTMPQIISKSIEDIKIKVIELSSYGFNKIDIFNLIKQYPYIIDMSDQRIKNKYQTFTDLGLKGKDINCLLLNKTSILNVDASTIKKKYDFLSEFGFKNKDIINIFRTCPDVIDFSLSKLNNKLDDLMKLGFKKNEIIKISLYFPNILLFSGDEFNKKVSSLLEFGFTSESIISIIKKIPIILRNDNLDSVLDKLNNLVVVGFSRDDAIKICEENCYILLFPKDVIGNNYDNFIDNDFYSYDVNKMIVDCPLLLTYNSSDILKKLRLYKEYKLYDYIKENSYVLLISLELIQKRLKYILDDNYTDLFLGHKDFYKKYKVTREKLLKE